MMPEYQRPFDEVLVALGSDAQRGLSASEAQERLLRYGANEPAAEPPVPRWRKFLAQFQDVLVILLLVATAISAALWLYERDSPLAYEAIAISGVVLLNAVMGYVQAVADARWLSPPGCGPRWGGSPGCSHAFRARPRRFRRSSIASASRSDWRW
jgi:magnesium-transporting ATPase (P-type)